MEYLFLQRTAALITISTVVNSLTIASSTLLVLQPANAQGCGVKDGFALPCFRDFLDSGRGNFDSIEGDESLPLYPYAKRANGCSIPRTRPSEYDNFASLGYNFSFREVCNNHDHCYYTLRTTPGQCNTAFTKGLFKVCEDGAFQPLIWQDVASGGGTRAKAVEHCFARAKLMSEAVIAAQSSSHPAAQVKQANYLKKVDEYIAASQPRTINGEPAFIFNDDSDPFIVNPENDNPVTVQPAPGRPNCYSSYECSGISSGIVGRGGDFEDEACVSIDSRKGWQRFNFPSGVSRVASVSGGWSVDTRNYTSVGASGHTGRDAEALTPYNQYKYDQNFPFGALIVDIPTDGYGYIWVQESQKLPKPITETTIRINDADNALGDNGGSLEVCFGN